jgi:hypothetical protein
MDFYHHKAIEDEIENELDLFFNPDQEESILFHIEEPILFKNEPAIVKQLRKEELQGKLPLWLADFNTEESNDSISKKQNPSKETNGNQSQTGINTTLIRKKFD